EDDGAVFHDGQETVELGAIEAMNLIHEEQRAVAGEAFEARFLENLLEVGNARKDGRDLLELEADLIGEETRDRCLAGAGRPPEDERAQTTGGQHAAQRATGAKQMLLTYDFVQRARPQLV